MNTNILRSHRSMYIEIKEAKLDISLIAQNPDFPLTDQSCNLIILNLDSIHEVDATGLTWFVSLIKQFRELGIKVYLTSNCKVLQTLDYLGIKNSQLLESQNQRQSAM